MRKLKITSIPALLATLFFASPAQAITFGEQDGNAHPYVGLVVFDVEGTLSHRRTGTLLSPTILLTAGHCTAGTDAARVWFESEVDDSVYPFSGGTSTSGTPYTHPNFDDFAGFPNTNDVGIVVLDSPVALPSYASLPTIGALDGLAIRRGQQDIIFKTVGYGLQSIVPDLMADRVRYTATSQLVSLRSALTDGYNLHISNNPGLGQGTGGTCFGDSGGPVFFPGSETIVAGIVSFGLNGNCVGGGFAYRTDLDNTQGFINQFLP